ncbi:MAG: hypothetical protein Q7S21_00615 [archaeon]|nr:hypothetical protein [archaeon]
MKMKTQKGLLFSLDLAFAMILWIAMIFLILFSLNQSIEQNSQEIKKIEFQKNAIMQMDLLMKNFDENNALNGIASIDLLKKRTQTGKIEPERLLEVKEKNIKEIKLITKNEAKTLIENNTKSSECISLQRMGIIESKEKAIIRIVFCNE